MALTKKQQQVYDRLSKGKDVQAIAKELKISVTGVYGHMRRIRASGVTLPEDKAATNGSPSATKPRGRKTTRRAPATPVTGRTRATPVATNGNGHHEADPRAAVLAALDAAQKSAQAIEQDIKAEITKNEEEISRLTSANQALANSLGQATHDLEQYGRAREAVAA